MGAYKTPSQIKEFYHRMGRDETGRALTAKLFINSFLTPVNGGPDAQKKMLQGKLNSPLMVYEPGLSRYEFGIRKGGDAPVTGNIRQTDIADIFARSEHAMKAQMDAELETDALPKCYSVTLSGRLKGKTPVSVLFEDPNGEETLRQQFEWLKSNLKKYRNNQVQMDAINEAVLLYRKGQLVKAGEGGRTYTIYTGPPKPLFGSAHPPKGDLYFVYQISILWHIGAKAPVEVTIENSYAPVDKKGDGTMTISMSKKQESKKASYSLTTAEWNDLKFTIDEDMRRFANAYEVTQRTEANRAEAENRKKYREKAAKPL